MIIRLLDIIFSTLGLLIFSPVFIPTYILLKCTGEHQAFYTQPRIGKNGKEFTLFKFSTMVKGAEKLPGGYLTQKDDPRVLPIGRILRKTKINELPQLFNIFLGQMSFVGPRPQARPHYDLYDAEVKKAIDMVPPGLTGIGSIVFRDEETMLDTIDMDRNVFHDTVIAPYKGKLELWYCKNRNLYTYFMLILLTAWALIRPRTIVWIRIFRSLPAVPFKLRKPLGIDTIKLVNYRFKRFIA